MFLKKMLSLFMVCGLSWFCSASPVTLVKEGGHPVPVIVPEKLSSSEQLALNELRLHLKKISGVDFPVVNAGEYRSGAGIALGMLPEGVKLEAEQRLVRTAGSRLYLWGGGYEGTLQAVYRFLEKELGCRWWNYAGHETIPEKKTIMVDVDRIWKENLACRSLMTFFHTLPHAHRFYARNGQNLLLGQEEVMAANRVLPVGKGNHSIQKFVPADKYFKDHPEYFPMDKKGVRVKGPQLCFSSRGLRKTMTENILSCARTWRKRHPRADQGQKGYIEVSVMDVPGVFCHCSECRKASEKYGTPGGAFFEYLAELCRTMQTEVPDVLISSLLYRKEQTEKPPAGLQMPDNFIGVFAPIDDNIFAPLDHVSNQETLKNLQGWCGISRNIWVWYYPDSYGVDADTPYSGLRRTIRDLELMKKAGIAGSFYEHDVCPKQCWNFADLGSWVMLKLFAEDCDAEALIREFMAGNYGKAAPLMLQYFNDLEKIREDAVKRGVVGYYACHPLQLGGYTTANLEKWSRRFDEMERLTADEQGDLDRVRLVRQNLDRLILEKWPEFSAESGYARSISPVILRDRLVRALEFAATRLHSWFPAKAQKCKELEAFVSQNLPEQFRNLPPEKIRQIFVTSGEKDPQAVFGYASVHTSLVRFPYGIYVNDYRSKLRGDKIKQVWTLKISRKLQKEDVVPDRYQLYLAGRTKLTNAIRVSTTEWAFFFKEMGLFFSEDHPDQEWDIYLSLKFEGPAIPGSTRKKDKVYLDRIVLVKR